MNRLSLVIAATRLGFALVQQVRSCCFQCHPF